MGEKGPAMPLSANIKALLKSLRHADLFLCKPELIHCCTTLNFRSYVITFGIKYLLFRTRAIVQRVGHLPCRCQANYDNQHFIKTLQA